jgi:hypothetical protein
VARGPFRKGQFYGEHQPLQIKIFGLMYIPAILDKPILKLIEGKLSLDGVCQSISYLVATDHARTSYYCTNNCTGDAEEVQ